MTPTALKRDARPLQMQGLYPATLTPFDAHLQIDLPALRAHLAQVAGTPGVQGIVVNAGLGEMLQLSLDEQVLVLHEARRILRPDQLLITGLGANSAQRAIEQARVLAEAGAQALLVFPPFDVRAYRRLIGHAPAVTSFFRTLAEGAGLPMIIFQYGPQSGCAYPVEVLQALAEIPQVVAVKATSGSLEAYRPVWDALHEHLTVLAAVDGPPLVEMLAYGAHGALVGISTIGTAHWVDLVQATAAGDTRRTAEIFERHCAPIMRWVWENHQPTRISSEVAATKEALTQLGLMPSSRVRPPAIDVDATTRAEITRGLHESGLVQSQLQPATV